MGDQPSHGPFLWEPGHGVYSTLDEALAAARTWQPDRNETCSLCVKGSYWRSGEVSY
jgi:hypothetical protein